MAAKPVAIIMGSQSDWATMKHAAEVLDTLGIGYEARIVSAHRTPDRLYAFAKGAKAAGFQVIIAGAGGAAHLPGMTAAMTTLPVFGVPVELKALSGLDSLYSIVQMPPGVPVGTLAIGRPGAVNAALIAASVLALADPALSRPARSLAQAPDRGGRGRAVERGRGVSAPAFRSGPDATIGILGGGQLGRMLAHGGGAPRLQMPRAVPRARLARLRRGAPGHRGRLRRQGRARPLRRRRRRHHL